MNVVLKSHKGWNLRLKWARVAKGKRAIQKTIKRGTGKECKADNRALSEKGAMSKEPPHFAVACSLGQDE